MAERVNTFEALLFMRLRLSDRFSSGDSGRLIQTWSGREDACSSPRTNRSGLLPKLVERVLPNAVKLQMLAAVDLRWREVRDALVVMSIVVPIECDRTSVLPLVESHSPIGLKGPYFKVLNCDSEYALSLLVRGRECDCVNG